MSFRAPDFSDSKGGSITLRLERFAHATNDKSYSPASPLQARVRGGVDTYSLEEKVSLTKALLQSNLRELPNASLSRRQLQGFVRS